MEDYKLYNRIDTFIDKIMKLQKWLKNETNIDIEAFKKRYQDKNNGPKTIYDCCDILTNFLSNTCTKRCQDIANKINEAIPNKNFIRITDVMDYYLNYQDKLQIKTCLGELASLDNQVKQKLEMDKIYRDIKKAGRGKFIGVGSGVKGALKGILTAGVANAAYGGLYELKNSIGNTMDTAFANTEVTENLHKADFKNLLYSVLINDLNYFIPVVADLAVDILNQYFNIKIEDVDYLYEKYRNIEKKVQARLNKNDIETFQECLQEYPFYPPIYKCILEEFGDKDNEIEDIGKFCGINLHPIKRNLLTEKTMSGNKGFITFEYKIYLGLQETTNQFMKIKEIVSKTDSNNPKSILLAIENLKNLNTQEAKDVIKEYMKKVITWADGKSPGYILSAVEDLKAFNTQEAKDIIKRYTEKFVKWIDGKNPKSILLAIEDLKTLNTKKAQDTIKEYMEKAIIWADGKSSEHILSTIDDLKTLNTQEAEYIIKEYEKKDIIKDVTKIKEIVSEIDGNNPKSMILAISKLKDSDKNKTIENYETIKRYEELITMWADGKSPERILSAIVDLKTLDLQEAKNVIKEYMEKVITWTDKKNSGLILSAIENLKTLDTPEAKDTIKEYEDAIKLKKIISETDENNPRSIVSAIENLKILDLQEAKDAIKKYIEKAIIWADKKSPELILSAIEDLKTLDTPEVKDIINNYKKKYLDESYVRRKDIIIEEGLIDDIHFSLDPKVTEEIKKEAQKLKNIYQYNNWNTSQELYNVIKKVESLSIYHETEKSINEMQIYKEKIEKREEFEMLSTKEKEWGKQKDTQTELLEEEKELQKKTRKFHTIWILTIFSLPLVTNYFFDSLYSIIIFVLLGIIGCGLISDAIKNLKKQKEIQEKISIYEKNIIQIQQKLNFYDKNNMLSIEDKNFIVPQLKKQFPVIQFKTFWILQLTNIQEEIYIFIIKQQNKTNQQIYNLNYSIISIYNTDDNFLIDLSDKHKNIINKDNEIKICLNGMSKEINIGSLWILFYGDKEDIENMEKASIKICSDFLENLDNNLDLWNA